MWPPRSALTSTTGSGTAARRIGWLEVDLGLFFDETVVARRSPSGPPSAASRPRTSTWPWWSTTRTSADAVAEVLAASAGDLLESVTLFDVYRGEASGAAGGAWPTDCGSVRPTTP